MEWDHVSHTHGCIGQCTARYRSRSRTRIACRSRMELSQGKHPQIPSRKCSYNSIKNLQSVESAIQMRMESELAQGSYFLNCLTYSPLRISGVSPLRSISILYSSPSRVIFWLKQASSLMDSIRIFASRNYESKKGCQPRFTSERQFQQLRYVYRWPARLLGEVTGFLTIWVAANGFDFVLFLGWDPAGKKK